MFALALLAGVCFVSLVAFRVRKNPAAASSVFVRLFGRISPKFGHAIGKRVLAFGEGLNTVKDMKSFLQLSALINCYLAIYRICLSCGDARLFHPSASQMTLSSVFLLTAASVVGGVLQLPVVGGGSQLATIGMLRGVFNLSPELATSCGIMLWLVTFMSVTPAGLAMARSEHVSLTQMEEASIQEEEKSLKED